MLRHVFGVGAPLAHSSSASRSHTSSPVMPASVMVHHTVFVRSTLLLPMLTARLHANFVLFIAELSTEQSRQR